MRRNYLSRLFTRAENTTRVSDHLDIAQGSVHPDKYALMTTDDDNTGYRYVAYHRFLRPPVLGLSMSPLMSHSYCREEKEKRREVGRASRQNPSIHPSVCPPVRPSIRPSVCPDSFSKKSVHPSLEEEVTKQPTKLGETSNQD